MILHLIDDEKVVNRVVESFNEALPTQNKYICFLTTEKGILVAPSENIFLYHGTEEPDVSFSAVYSNRDPCVLDLVGCGFI